MQRFRWIALQGSSRGLLLPLLLFVFLITTSGIPAHAADDPAACISPVARVVSIQGTIELLRARQNDWSKVTRLDTSLCEGDRLRTGALSRAALFIQPETLVRVDQNTSISVSQTAEETLVELTQEDVLPAAASAYSCGAGYFIARFPRNFRAKTPHLNAAVEGTEFLVAMRCESTELSVFEGKVLAASAGANVFPAQSISNGQVLTIGGSDPPAVKLLVKPTDAVQWVVYYPPLSDATAEADLPPAEQCRTLPKPLDQTCLTQRAEALLRLGRVDEAQREVDEAVALGSEHGDANALRAIISLARNDKAGAIEAATAATTASPNSFRAWLALSYAQQASFKLDDSLASARKAEALEPNNSVANARVAELLMSLGRIKEAEVAARAAVDANPAESRARAVLGFVHLAQINTKAARADFEAAIERDSSDPLPRLGLGLAIIRTGKLAEGREQLEIAVALDPTNSLLRSYVGKAYYEENSKERDPLAAIQFGLAKSLDRNDPTPWFYDAFLKESHARAVEALDDLQKSIDLNDNRAVYRSRFLLDQDETARSANLARIYEDMAFDELALMEAVKSLAEDSGNYSAHRFLAEVYAVSPRTEIASQSEYLQSLLRQPLNSNPITPFRASGNPMASFLPRTGAVRVSGPSVVAFNEFNSLFDQNGSGLFVDALTASQNTLYDQVAATVLGERVALKVAQGYFQTDGFEDNRDFRENAYDLLLQAMPGWQTSVQLELNQSSTKRGDVFASFDTIFRVPVRIEETAQMARIGALQVIDSRSDVLLSGIYQTSDVDFATDTTDSLNSEAGTGEAQYAWRGERLGLVAGLGNQKGKLLGAGSDLLQDESYNNAYIYGQLRDPSSRLRLILGMSYTSYEDLSARDRATCPKLGLILTPFPGTTIRAAALQSLKRPLIANQTIEPTQVAGFTQFFDDFNGTLSWRYGLAVNQRLPQAANIGFELTQRDIDVPAFGTTYQWREDGGRTYLYLPIRGDGDRTGLARWSRALAAEYQYERLDRPVEFTGDEGFVFLDTQYIPLMLSAFPGAYTSVHLRTTYVNQRGRRQINEAFPSYDSSTSFWTTDLELAYRLPGRRGRLAVGIADVFDTQHDFTEPDPVHPKFTGERMAFARLSLRF